jgi:hypothetical protein
LFRLGGFKKSEMAMSDPVPTVSLPAPCQGRAGEPTTLPPPDAAGQALPREGVVVPGYEVCVELGRGGMGVVYQAWQVKANRTLREEAPGRTGAVSASFLQHSSYVSDLVSH